MSFKQTTDVFDFIIEHGLTQSKHPKTCLVKLHEAITQLPLINYFTEVEQDLDRVLTIFIRVNSGGTPLSYSDLLLSIASAQWEERDAREAIHALVDEINGEYGIFVFPRDFVLKSCLMLADVDLRWRGGDFNRANMQKIEVLWPRIEQAIRLAVETVSSFGFTGKTLASANAVIPIMYYLFQRDSPSSFAKSAVFQTDREVIQRWLNIVLLKRTFGGVPDNVLRRMRDVIRAYHDSFPSDAIAADLEATPLALCSPSPTRLCLLGGRFSATLRWDDGSGAHDAHLQFVWRPPPPRRDDPGPCHGTALKRDETLRFIAPPRRPASASSHVVIVRARGLLPRTAMVLSFGSCRAPSDAPRTRI